jgi:hypothetical protein
MDNPRSEFRKYLLKEGKTRNGFFIEYEYGFHENKIKTINGIEGMAIELKGENLIIKNNSKINKNEISTIISIILISAKKIKINEVEITNDEQNLIKLYKNLIEKINNYEKIIKIVFDENFDTVYFI